MQEQEQSTEQGYIRPAERLLAQKVQDEMVMLDLERGVYYGLDPVGTRMFELACQLPSAAQVVAVLRTEFDAPAAVLEHDLESFLDELAAAGLIERAATEATDGGEGAPSDDATLAGGEQDHQETEDE